MNGCKHEGLAISAYEHVMKEKHKNFKIVKCGMFINKEYHWLHATLDFLCSCYCCGKGVRCCNPKCPIVSFHLSCVKIKSITKRYCPHCRNLPEFKKSRKAKMKESKEIKGSLSSSWMNSPIPSLEGRGRGRGRG